ncbi:MAG: TonB-dependent receptor [Bryobacterales bacterium]|nr:TonB-dependent receptor [Bryobacterales bacterium]
MAPAIRAQTATQILGLVTDSSGAAVVGAKLTAKHVETGDVRTTESNETGNYIFPVLRIGQYQLTCSAAGFKSEVRTGIALQLQQQARFDLQLTVGQQVETVEVQASGALLRTEDATLGSVVEHKRIVELPLNGRNFAQLATLMPGVNFGASRMGLNGQGTATSTWAMPGQIAGISANGQRDANQNITLDGVVSVDSHQAAMLFSPSIEAIEEFKIQSAVYSAEFGMNSGAQADLAIKSGGNTFHGTGFEFLRNDALDARGYFLAPSARKNTLRRNQFGGVFSGPIIKDKTFFLANYEGRVERRASPAVTAAPTVAMRNGDFSEILIPGNRWYPSDRNPAVNRAIRAPGSPAPFPNNIIPRSLIHPVSINLLTYKKYSPFPEGGFLAFPSQDELARSRNSTLNLAGTNDQILDSGQYLGRGDHRFSSNDRVFGHYVIVESQFNFNPVTRVTETDTDYRAQHFAIGYTKILSTRVLNDLRFGMNRMRVLQGGLQTNTGFRIRDLGLDMRVAGDNNRTLTPIEEGIPNISITGFSGLGSGTVQVSKKIVWEASDSVIYSVGEHNFKIGGLYRFNIVDIGGSNLPRGQMTFTPDIAGIPDGMAAFMLGVPLNSNSAEGAPFGYIRQNKFGLFWLDDYKATSKLTINFGIRYDYFGPVYDAQGKIRTLSFERGIARTINNVFVPMLYPDPNVRDNLYDVNRKQIMPRLGIAYRFTGTTVLRLGAGNFYNAQQTNNFSILNLNPPFSGSVVFQNDRNNPTATIDRPFAGSPVTGSPAALLQLGYLNENGRSQYRNSDIWQWSAEIEQSFGKSAVLGIAYVGSAASNLENSVLNFNNPDPGPGAVQGRRPFQTYVDSRDPHTPLALGTIRRNESWASANYNGLQARLEKRLSSGLTFQAAFTYSRAMAIGYGVNEGAGFGGNYPQNPRDRRADYGRSNIDQRLRFVYSNVYEMPWMRAAEGVKGFFLGGWSLNSIIVLQSGLPVTVAQNGDSQNTGPASAQRPHVAAGAVVPRVWANRSVMKWFDTSAFVRSKYEGSPGEGLYLPGTLGYGNAGAGLFDAPAQKTWDFALFKEFRVREGHKLQFRWELFNFLNTPQFSGPDRTLGSVTFGVITATAVNSREMQFGLKYIF